MVVLYFPYNISLRAFIAEQKLQVKPEPGCLFLRASLKQDQIERACSVFGAILYE